MKRDVNNPMHSNASCYTARTAPERERREGGREGGTGKDDRSINARSQSATAARARTGILRSFYKFGRYVWRNMCL